MLTLPTTVDAPLLIHGDCIDQMRLLPAASVDVVITDPPAAVGFMGLTWDSFKGYAARTRAGRLTQRRLGGTVREYEWRASLAGEEEVAIVRVPMPDGSVMVLEDHDEDPWPA